jgi:hypothetical protein
MAVQNLAIPGRGVTELAAFGGARRIPYEFQGKIKGRPLAAFGGL